MAHYGMLRDYRFTEDVDDIRGADLYAADGKIGTVKDVIFDHDTGDIQYLVADLGHDRRVLIDSRHVFRATTDEDSFETDLPAAEISRLPRFDEQSLESEHEWERHRGENRKLWKEREDRYRDEYKREWEEDPVMHMKDSERAITPDMGPAEGNEQPVITAADVFPRRIVDKFAQRGPMTVPSTNEAAEDVTLRPARPLSDEEDAASGIWERSERLRRFQNSMRSQMAQIRQVCAVCGINRRVA